MFFCANTTFSAEKLVEVVEVDVTLLVVVLVCVLEVVVKVMVDDVDVVLATRSHHFKCSTYRVLGHIPNDE